MTAEALRSTIARVATVGCVLMAIIVVSSAYLRLSTTGIGCAGWPACYGQVRPAMPTAQAVPAAEATRGTTVARFAHRVSAMAAGVVVALLLALSLPHGARTAANLGICALLVALTVFLATLGRYTTGSLSPAVTVANLLGGHAMLALLWALRLVNTADAPAPWTNGRGVQVLGIAAVCAIVFEVICGGIVSAKFATTVCTDVIACWPKTEALAAFGRALDPSSPLVLDAAGRVVPGEDAAAAHALHRAGGLVVAAFVCGFAVAFGRSSHGWRLAGAMIALVVLQALLGWGLASRHYPLVAALAHSAIAVTLLLVVLATIIGRVGQDRATAPAA